jgi:hypothetical protein
MSLTKPAAEPASSAPALFASRPPEPSERSLASWLIAGLVVVLVLGGVLLLSRGKPAVAPNTILPVAANASTLAFSTPVMSEATSLSGGKSTYIDGRIRNTGSATVTAATVQVIFANDEQLPPQVDTLPLTLIRTRQPYVDTEPISAEPLKPGDEREFRLIFEDIGKNWNQQLPEIHVVALTTR